MTDNDISGRIDSINVGIYPNKIDIEQVVNGWEITMDKNQKIEKQNVPTRNDVLHFLDGFEAALYLIQMDD